MPIYLWNGKTRSGEKRSGELEAASADAVALHLKNMGVVPGKVKEKPKDISEIFPFLAPKVKIKDLVVFTRQFAVMVDAGLPLVQCLSILAEQQDNVTFKGILRAVKADVEQGSTFAEALAKHPQAFDDLFVNLVAAGEVGGILDTILNRLAVQLEKQEKLRKQLKGAMVYPATVSVIAVACIVLLLVKVIPVFEQMFTDFGGSLPGPTQMVIDLSNWLQAYIVYLLAGVGAVVVAYAQSRKRSESFRYQTDNVMLNLPIFGNIIKKVAVARFTRTLGTMISSGVPILDGLEIVAKTAGNMIIEEEIQRTRQSISEGKTIAEPLQGSKIFPGMMVQMVAVGEETGSMEAMLTKIADFYDDEVDAAVAALTAMLEPLMMVFMGGSIGTILIAMYLPIFTIADTIT
ncbi:MAG: type II secretion system F family protein [Deltaproteobacteria bacterium]|jgi:type IV pilus assembly protein PilC|nr:type II secretion system F family protein [Deltaproteobacteria bacterium]MBW2498003.1 type II secretion system F family protein [Deltaproteobacteria bacterium]